MGTSFGDIISNHAMVEIDDVRLQEQLKENPALFFRRMTMYMKNGIPYFSSPPQMEGRLAYTDPEWDEFTWEGVASSAPTTVSTGKIGYELASIQASEELPNGDIVWAPYTEATYDSATGEITFPAGIPDGQVFEVDFYTDGYFLVDLTNTEKRILGLCVALVWYERFETNWLNLQPKIHDESFTTVNEASHMKATTERIKSFRSALNAEIRKYEQNLAYSNTVLKKSTFPPFF